MKTINTIIVVTILIIALMHCFVRFTGTETDTIVPVPEQETAQDNTVQSTLTFDESIHEQDTVRNDTAALVESSDVKISFDSDKTQTLIEPPLQWGEVRVAAVIAGDVLLLDNGKIVKLIGVDVVDTTVSTEATALTKRAMRDSGNIVILYNDGNSTDELGRQLAIVYFYSEKEGVKVSYNLNHVLLWHGLTKVQMQGNYSQAWKDSFIQAEKDAQQRKVGIWRGELQNISPMEF